MLRQLTPQPPHLWPPRCCHDRNISPQVGKGFNRDYWARFERFAKTLLTDKHTELFIVTGPLYVPKRKSSFSKAAGWEMNHPMLGAMLGAHRADGTLTPSGPLAMASWRSQ